MKKIIIQVLKKEGVNLVISFSVLLILFFCILFKKSGEILYEGILSSAIASTTLSIFHLLLIATNSSSKVLYYIIRIFIVIVLFFAVMLFMGNGNDLFI